MIKIKGARTHNLKNVDLELPHNKLIVITGISGSGKSSLAFDTLFAEGQRRYVESLSAYARQFLTQMEKPDADLIEGLSPAISIDQKTTSHNPRSTVGTVTEIHDYLRLLYARIGVPYCPDHAKPLTADTIDQMVDRLMTMTHERLAILAPVVRERKGEYTHLFEKIRAEGFLRTRIDGEMYEIDDIPQLSLRRKHTIEVVVDRLKIKPGVESRLAESLETTLKLSDGIAHVQPMDGKRSQLVLSAKFACPMCGYTLDELEPRLFSFNSPMGACEDCEGLGEIEYFDVEKIVNPALSLCGGAIDGRDKRNTQYLATVNSLAKHYNFEPDTPFKKLPRKIRDIILYGSGDEEIAFDYRSAAGKKIVRRHSYKGVIPALEDSYEKTNSEQVRIHLRRFLSLQDCPGCDGTRLNVSARNVYVNDTSLPQVAAMSIEQALEFFCCLKLDKQQTEIAEKILVEIKHRLSFLINVGLDYLTLNRSASTLSGGEAQRIRLASQIGSGLVGVMYVLDEPSVGLHQRDNQRLLDTLVNLRNLGNTVIVVEHDEEAIRHADHIVDIGPGAGKHGGKVVACGGVDQIEESKDSLTGQYLSHKLRIPLPETRNTCIRNNHIVIEKASGNNLKDINVRIPLGLLVCVTGVSGSGKSTLVNETLYKQLANTLHRGHLNCAPCKAIKNLEKIDKAIDIDQSPIGRTPRSNPATYVGVFTPIRELFTQTQTARMRGYTPGRFSFNVKGGRCEACEGAGVKRVEMHFLPDIYVVCDICKGKRYNRETLDVRYKEKNIQEILNMTIEEAHDFFRAIPVIHSKLQTLIDVGLSYLVLGQNSTLLSGGEAQRVKLARELSKRNTGKTLYILDEPTTGLHFHDVAQLLKVLHKLRDKGNTIIVVEHNMDVIKTADWIIDLGPEGGKNGGELVATGTPEEIVKNRNSWTGRYLKSYLDK